MENFNSIEENKNKLPAKFIKFGIILSSLMLGLFFFMVMVARIKGKYSTGINNYTNEIFFIIVWVLIIVTIICIINKYFDGNNLIKSIILISILMILPRIILMSTVKVIEISDYKLYMDVATAILNTTTAGLDRYYIIAIANNVIPISSMFALWFSVFGSSLFSALSLNLLLFIGSGYLFYFICREITTSKNALSATLIYVLWPEFIFYQLVLASEFLYLFFSMLGIYLFLRAFRCKRNFKITFILVILGSISLTVSNAIRPVGIIILITCIIYVIYYSVCNRIKFIKVISMMAAILIVFITLSAISNMWTKKILDSNLSTMSWGWSLYEGTNTETWGGWSPKTSEKLMEVLNDNLDNLPNVQKIMYNLATERLNTYDTETLAALFRNKAVNMWGSNDFAVSFSIAQQDLENSLVNLKPYESYLITYTDYLWYGICVIFIIANFYYVVALIKKKNVNMNLLIFTLPVAGVMMVHSVVTAISRYKYPAIPFIILAVVYFTGEVFNGDKDIKANNHQEDLDIEKIGNNTSI